MRAVIYIAELGLAKDGRSDYNPKAVIHEEGG